MVTLYPGGELNCYLEINTEHRWRPEKKKDTSKNSSPFRNLQQHTWIYIRVQLQFAGHEWIKRLQQYWDIWKSRQVTMFSNFFFFWNFEIYIGTADRNMKS